MIGQTIKQTQKQRLQLYICRYSVKELIDKFIDL